MKTHSIVAVVLSILTGAIVFMSTDCGAPQSGQQSGPRIGTFTVSGEYIDFHSWYGEISWSGTATLDPALLVVSTSETAKDWDGTATLSAQGELTAVGIAGVSVDAVYSRKFDSADLKTRNVYISVNDLYSDGKFDDLLKSTGKHNNFTSAADYEKAPWLMRANTSYYVHIYYKEGEEKKTYTHPFKTPEYPATAEQADALFTGENWMPTGVVFFNIEGAPGTIEIKRDLGGSGSSSEPFVYSRGSYYAIGPASEQTQTFNNESQIAGACVANAPCDSGLSSMLLLHFTDHSLAFRHLTDISEGSFGVVDLIFFTKSAPSGKDANNVNKDGDYTFSWGSAPSKKTKIQSITE